MPQKPIRLINGRKISGGQLFEPKIGRDPRTPKRIANPTIAHGMRDVGASGHPLAFDGARRPLDDEPNSKTFLNGKSAPIHSGMGSKTMSERGTDKGQDHGSAVLQAAGRRGRDAT
jgi:hypothetical protein